MSSSVGNVEPQIVALNLAGQVRATVLFEIDGATVSLTFEASAFLAFVEQLRVFAATMPGKPS